MMRSTRAFPLYRTIAITSVGDVATLNVAAAVDVSSLDIKFRLQEIDARIILPSARRANDIRALAATISDMLKEGSAGAISFSAS